MPLVINTNVSSLNARRSLGASQKMLATSLQRLSSGSRINNASDDAAGLAISERFTSQIRGLNQSVRNANDAISLAQTAEGAMTEIGNNLQRIRELSVQSRNATNSASDRSAMQTEVLELKNEIDRLANQADFNGTKLLDGSFTNNSFQIGANVGETIDIGAVVNATSSGLGTWIDPDVQNYVISPTGPAIVGADIMVSDITDLALSAGYSTEQEAKEDLLTKVATFMSGHAVVSANFNSSTGDLTVTNDSWAQINLGLSAIGGTDALVTVGNSLVLNIDDVNVPIVNDQTQTGFNGVDVSTLQGADNAILAIDAALTDLNSARAQMGAIQNRFESVVSSLQTTAENMANARSRIVDTDFAEETAKMTRAQIMQQAGTAMLAQANSQAQNILSLLQ